ncbi:MAG: hypothetical protein QOE62_243, partial [Actinomycetota bacterium]|nr:hypothetical protein [Actinomycetota bacterium]
LIGATRHAQATFDTAAQEIARADLPTAANPAPTDPVAPNPPRGEVDLAGQLVTMTVAADLHHVTAAALRSAFSLYQDSLELIRTDR